VKKQVKFTFPTGLITVPVIYKLGKKFNIITNIRRANVREGIGWVILELEGDEKEITTGLDWIISEGVRVDPVSGNVVES
jgi:hypothetical protein